MTVREAIEHLQKLDQEAIVCRFEIDEAITYSTIETISPIDCEYIDDSGEVQKGSIISIH